MPAKGAKGIFNLCRQVVIRSLEMRDLLTIIQLEDNNRRLCHRQTGVLQTGEK
jgi:hypothetical protein